MSSLKKSMKAAYSPRSRRLRPKVKTMDSLQLPKPSRFGTTESTSTAANMKVCVRIRPPNHWEVDTGRRIVVKPVDSRMLIFDPKVEEEPFFYQGVQQPSHNYLKKANKEMQFIFDTVFGVQATNVDVFNESTKDIITSLMEGYNCSVFVYGATGAGKTFTMVGYPETPGITYLTMRELFKCIEQHRQEREFEICVSYLEIYNENVHDLLQPSGSLHLRDDGKYGVQISGLSSKSINTAQELLDMLDKGNKNRTQHPTDANAESSRSHAVFQVYVKMRTKATNQAKIVKLSMIDLAGSERASATGCKGDRFKEGANINRSLLSLGNCINQLADGAKFIPYRDSKLTRLLKDSLGGNCRTVMIANVAPTSSSYEDTYNTLKYATRANKIQQKMKKNIISCDGHVAQYIKQAEELRERVSRLENELTQADGLKEKVAHLEAELARAKENQTGVVTGFSDVKTDEISEKLLKKWSVKLKSQSEVHFANLSGVLSRQRKQRGFASRAIRKRRAAAALAALCVEAPDPQLKNECRNDVSRLQSSSESLIRQAVSMQSELEKALEELESSESDFKRLKTEAVEACPILEPLAVALDSQQDSIISEAKADHLKSLTISHVDEITNLNSFVKNSLDMLKKYYIRLKSQGIFTSAMVNEYKDLIRQAKSSRAVTWKDEQDDLQCDDAYLKYMINLDLKNASIPDGPIIDIVQSPEIGHLLLSDMEEDVVEGDPTDEDEAMSSEDVLNSTYVEPNGAMNDLQEDTFIMLNGHGKDFVSTKTVNPNMLNSTFVLAHKAVNDCKAIKTVEIKKVLSERTNVFESNKLSAQKLKLPTGKVAPFKRPVTISTVKENKSGFGSSANRFHLTTTVNSIQSNNTQVGCKTVRNKERTALASTVLPYRRPQFPVSRR
ncbi:uncharacterized protein LOC143916627 [Arctopsyche grandis]|uniref:uncharacterized protein LOC143916627 n=1 Tax=Arctopsyche grandis TaxID=121162 RepID=UPI00406D6C8C